MSDQNTATQLSFRTLSEFEGAINDLDRLMDQLEEIQRNCEHCNQDIGGEEEQEE